MGIRKFKKTEPVEIKRAGQDWGGRESLLRSQGEAGNRLVMTVIHIN